jgi:GNAT superfamily N-acetyltransferase
MKVTRLRKEFIPAAAALFTRNFTRQRLAVPELPGLMEDRGHIESMLEECFEPAAGLAAVEDGRLVGYLAWFLVDRFRGTERRGAYVPEWGHACLEEDRAGVYRALYRAAGEVWQRAGCGVHAVTVLAHDARAEQAWYWNGFGLVVVDAIRSIQPLQSAGAADVCIRRAGPEDAALLADLDAEHCRHYSRSPVFMPPRAGLQPAEQIELLARSRNGVWLALDGDTPAGFLRIQGYDFDTAAILESEEGVTITGAYVRPAYRRRRLALALLDCAMRDLQARGFHYCAVNFESFNPEAAAFWMKYFQPVCFSLLRVPELTGARAADIQ